ncbi:hypothetical protein AB0G86_24050 [Streptomyces scabiei]|uniref:hypothetical protein n=1 Tax=Streptomyces TaxID=1883 RepID=UPI0029AE493F|nr:hypothetical protein [Streptomyces sp. ND04-05B]MDX3069031.1 hypothetical protein [Streptomyces sp. ND04-05B]
MEPVEIEAKTLIQKSKTPSNDYVINPYTGCVLGCAYCFASFAGRQFGRSAKEWGDYLYVRRERGGACRAAPTASVRRAGSPSMVSPRSWASTMTRSKDSEARRARPSDEVVLPCLRMVFAGTETQGCGVATLAETGVLASPPPRCGGDTPVTVSSTDSHVHVRYG